MTTGYTAYIEETEDPKFDVFVMGCARAFGACITLREDGSSISDPFPEFEVPDFYSKTVDKARESLKELEDMSEEDIIVASNSEYEKRLKEHEEWVSDRLEQNRKYADMLNKVKAWKPPSDEHVELKDFMIDQINMSIRNYDVSNYAPKKVSHRMWYCERVNSAKDYLKRSIESYNKQVERNVGANKWVRDLRESLI